MPRRTHSSILRDRLWFFGGVQKTRHNDRPAGYDGHGAYAEAAAILPVALDQRA